MSYKFEDIMLFVPGLIGYSGVCVGWLGCIGTPALLDPLVPSYD